MQVQKQTKNAAVTQSINPIWKWSRQAWDHCPVANCHVRGLTRAPRVAAVCFRISIPFEQHRSPCRLSYQTTNQLKHRYARTLRQLLGAGKVREGHVARVRTCRFSYFALPIPPVIVFPHSCSIHHLITCHRQPHVPITLGGKKMKICA